jgi:ribosomal protein S18 acetylase RimI-like enzyme
VPVLLPMSEAEFHAFVGGAIVAYAADKAESGEWTQEESMAMAVKSFDELLPQGQSTPDHHLFTIRDDGARSVGMLWFAVRKRAGARIAYVYNVRVEPEHQRRGHAGRALRALDEEARRLGLAGVALHVFGHNPGAQALYAKLGYRPTNINMYKPLGKLGG